MLLTNFISNKKEIDNMLHMGPAESTLIRLSLKERPSQPIMTDLDGKEFKTSNMTLAQINSKYRPKSLMMVSTPVILSKVL